MVEREARNKPGQGNTFEQNAYQEEHERLVSGLRAYIAEQKRHIGRHQTPEEIICAKLASEKLVPPLKTLGEDARRGKFEFFDKLQTAWEIITYDRYEIRSPEEMKITDHLSGVADHYHPKQYAYPRVYNEDKAWAVTLNPYQSRIIDAMADATGVPYRGGHTEFTVPRKLRNRTEYMFSDEYTAKYEAYERRRRR
jgi:hypothetical protein